MKVERINLDGELGIVNAARVSFNNQKITLDEKDKKLIEYLKKHNHKSPFFHPQVCFTQDYFDISNFNKTDIAGLEWYINKNEWRRKTFVRASLCVYKKLEKKFTKGYGLDDNDISFNETWLLEQEDLLKASRLPYLSFKVECPMFVRNQLDRHRVGFAINEMSRRYVRDELEFYYPEKWRQQSQSNKQGSIENKFVNEKPTKNGLKYEDILKLCEEWYNANTDDIKDADGNIIQKGMCGEQARMILPLSLMTKFVWTASLQDYARLCKMRLQPDSQIETQEIVKQIYEFCKTEFPNTFDKIIKNIE